MDTSLRFLLAVPSSIKRTAILAHLKATLACTVIEFGEGAGLRAAFQRAPSSVVVIDSELSPLGGLDLALEAAEATLEPRIVLISSRTSVAHALAARRCGVLGYLHPAADLAELTRTVQSVLVGRPYLSLPFLEGDRLDFADEGLVHAEHPPAVLTRREREVLPLMLRWYQSREIAERLFLSHRTVETHCGRILAKFGVESRRELICRLCSAGIAPHDLAVQAVPRPRWRKAGS